MLPKSLQRYFQIQLLTTPGASAAAYVPFVFLARALAFLRLLIVAHLLGNAGQEQFGIYQPALEFINWIVPLVMFGLADVIERYAAQFKKQNQLHATFKKHIQRILLIGIPLALLLTAAAPWIAPHIWKPDIGNAPSRTHDILLVGLCSLVILLLALYQYLAATLRGLRAYSASAGLETTSAILLLILSAIAARLDGAPALLIAYAAATLLPLVLYWLLLNKFFRKSSFEPITPISLLTHSFQTDPILDYQSKPDEKSRNLSRFARWTLLRLILVMTFGFLTLWSVGFLSPTFFTESWDNYATPQQQIARFSMSYRVAQLLAFIAVTLWSSSYGIAAAAWSHGQIHRAKVQIFRVGKFGMLLLILTALALLLARGILSKFLPSTYTDSILNTLPPMLALFIWYSLLLFSSVYADLQEKPHLGAVLWAAAIIIQLTAILIPLNVDPQQHSLIASTLAIALPLFLLAPILLCRPFKFTATAVPLVLLAIVPVTLFAPSWVVDWIAAPAMLAAIAFLFMARLLIRPIDRRAFRRWRSRQHVVSQSR